MNKPLINQRFSKVIDTYDNEAWVQKKIAQQLFLMIPPIFTINSLLEIGCGSGFLTRLFIERFHPTRALINDMSPQWTSYVQKHILPQHWQICTEDAEEMTLSASFDCIASASTIQWFEQPALFIQKMYQHLNRHGILLISTFGKNNCKEITSITHKTLPYPSIETLTSLLPKHCHIEKIEEEMIETFLSPLAVLQHLKKTGTNAIEQSRWTKKTMNDFITQYNHQFLVDGQVSLTYHPVYLIITKP